MNVERGRAERVHHFEDAHVHPGATARFWVLGSGEDPRRDAAEMLDPLAAGVLGFQEVRVRGVNRTALLVGDHARGRLGGRGGGPASNLGARHWGRGGWRGRAQRSPEAVSAARHAASICAALSMSGLSAVIR